MFQPKSFVHPLVETTYGEIWDLPSSDLEDKTFTEEILERQATGEWGMAAGHARWSAIVRR
jgi:hypothetical protein